MIQPIYPTARVEPELIVSDSVRGKTWERANAIRETVPPARAPDVPASLMRLGMDVHPIRVAHGQPRRLYTGPCSVGDNCRKPGVLPRRFLP